MDEYYINVHYLAVPVRAVYLPMLEYTKQSSAGGNVLTLKQLCTRSCCFQVSITSVCVCAALLLLDASPSAVGISVCVCALCACMSALCVLCLRWLAFLHQRPPWRRLRTFARDIAVHSRDGGIATSTLPSPPWPCGSLQCVCAAGEIDQLREECVH